MLNRCGACLASPQVYDRVSRVRKQRRATQQYHGPFTYWDMADFAALAVVAAALSVCGFRLGVRCDLPTPPPFVPAFGKLDRLGKRTSRTSKQCTLPWPR